MIEINNRQYYSKYVPADKSFFRTLHNLQLLLKNASNIKARMGFWEVIYDLKARIQEIKDIKKDNKFNFILNRKLNNLLSAAEHELLCIKYIEKYGVNL